MIFASTKRKTRRTLSNYLQLHLILINYFFQLIDAVTNQIMGREVKSRLDNFVRRRKRRLKKSNGSILR